MKKLTLFLFSLLVLFSCGKDLETITVKSDPSRLFSTSDSVITSSDTTGGDDFIHIKIGEIAKIESLDPLFASSNSEWRILNLIYEKLVDLNDLGNPAPALAKRWEVNRDSTQFTFHLKTSVFYHDSPVFDSGTGRRFTARDVQYIFERMAINEVPDFAAYQFEDIRGFSDYHNEITYVKDPAKRVVRRIEGINVRNDSTIIFSMNKSAPDFLHRLAHPMASVYPRESVPEGYGAIQDASGTGLFSFVKKENHAHLLTINSKYPGFTPTINRLDIVSRVSEKDIYQEFARENLHALIEPGASTLKTVADSSGNLLSNIFSDFKLTKVIPLSEYRLYFNKKSGQDSQVNELISALDSQTFFEHSFLGSISFENVSGIASQNSDSRQIIITQSRHPLELNLIDELAQKAAAIDFSVSMKASYAYSGDVTFTTRPYEGTQAFITWNAPLYVLTRKSLSGIRILKEPWNMDLTLIKLSEEN